MSRVHNVECNMCGKLLRGRRGTAWIERDHIGLKGSMVQQTFDRDNNSDHYYITSNPTEEHHFCDFDCLIDYAEHRKNHYEAVQRRKVQEEVDRAYKQ